jgi:hypothetical protein
MTHQQNLRPLADDTDNYLIGLEDSFKKQKESFQKGIINNSDSETIIGKANLKVINSIDNLIEYIQSLRKELHNIAAAKVNLAVKGQPDR